MSVALTAALPLMNTDNTTSNNTDRVFRKFMAGLMLPDVKSANPLSVRNGVLPHNWDSNGCTSLRPQSQSTPTMNVDVLAGASVIERSGQGPYFVYGESTVTIPVATADLSNPRIDVIYAWVGDQSVSGNTDALHGPVVDILTGTPNATPVAPTNLPDGAIVLAQVAVAANATAINAINVTDMRKSTSLVGAVRHLLPGDSVSDPGKVDGEMRFRTAVSPLPALVDYWDGAQSQWRGTQPFIVVGTFPGTPNSANNVSGTGNTSRTTPLTITIPDPGFPYRVTGSGYLYVTATGGGSCNVYASVNNGNFCSALVTTLDGHQITLTPIGNNVYTGSSTVRVNIDTIGGATGCTWKTDVRNVFTVTIYPA